jgi:hypothetical protein
MSTAKLSPAEALMAYRLPLRGQFGQDRRILPEQAPPRANRSRQAWGLPAPMASLAERLRPRFDRAGETL